jgi:hypothetical protein
MDEIVIMDLINKKIALLTTIASTSMLWWVSATVFCATILGGIWRYREHIESAPFKNSLGFLPYFFFGSVVLYGLLVTGITLFGFLDVRALLSELGAPANLFDAEFLWIIVGMPVGTSSFVLFLLVWHHMWKSFGAGAGAKALRPIPGVGVLN